MFKLKHDEAFEYDEDTLELKGIINCQPNPQRPGEFLTPANSTKINPPLGIGTSKWVKFNKKEKKWDIIPDNRFYYQASQRGFEICKKCELAFAYIIDCSINNPIIHIKFKGIKESLIYADIEKAKTLIANASIDEEMKGSLNEILQ